MIAGRNHNTVKYIALIASVSILFTRDGLTSPCFAQQEKSDARR